jgi:hypothetical protein
VSQQARRELIHTGTSLQTPLGSDLRRSLNPTTMFVYAVGVHYLFGNPETTLRCYPGRPGILRARRPACGRRCHRAREYKAARSEGHSTHSTQVPPRFGLLDASDTRWVNLSAKLHELNAGDDAVSYKLFFFGRHGEGYRASSHEESGTQFMTGLKYRQCGEGEVRQYELARVCGILDSIHPSAHQRSTDTGLN